ncbi:protein phosphatase 2C domain-containing protein [Magnetospirillum sp. 15-1]|uniref:PP2C family protein-serine/threonine phosphatase n=1 Tax=Magnetospirillum sp. 15-1 TaxID=1979370 RepID=UPI000BBBB2E3|nr:protein phosphatase 2C domain-containing protein [Magnetospirillum sp. 15-1]
MQIEAGSAPFGPYRLNWVVGTDQGHVRQVNEDAARAAPLPSGDGLLVALSDGMGGHVGGRIAANLVVDAILSAADQDLSGDRPQRYETLVSAMDSAQDAISARISEDFSLMKMGATGVAALFAHGECLHLYAGDSRLYRFPGNGGPAYQTTDHSVIQVLLDLGQITPEQARDHPMASVITSCFGGGPQARLTIAPEIDSESPSAFLPVAANDLFLLCSDGLCKEIDHSTLVEMVAGRYTPEKLVQACIEAALNAGGHDNITVAVVMVEQMDASARNDDGTIGGNDGIKLEGPFGEK